MVIAITLNCLLAVLVCWLTSRLWQWRCALTHVNQALQNHKTTLNLAPKQAGYAIALRRMQLIETRLSLAQWQQRSRQLQQTLQLIRGLQTIVLMRSRRQSFHRSGK